MATRGGTKWAQEKVGTREEQSGNKVRKVGTREEQSGNKVGSRTHKWEQENKVGTKGNKVGSRIS